MHSRKKGGKIQIQLHQKSSQTVTLHQSLRIRQAPYYLIQTQRRQDKPSLKVIFKKRHQRKKKYLLHAFIHRSMYCVPIYLLI